MDRIVRLEKEITEIRKTLHEKERELYALKKEWIPMTQANGQAHHTYTEQFQQFINAGKVQFDRLPKWAIERYSRQILLPDIGVLGQEKLCAAKVLIVGAGGLGCPAAIYLAGAGIGEIGIVDYDTVDLTNIHRQILHGESDEHMSKVESAADTLRSINSKITITPYNVQLSSSNALEIASKYDIVLDCTDNVPTRYMLNDVCVLAKLPLISGSALKMEGQITIYGYRATRNVKEKEPNYVGPCYRCVFPTPPPAEAVGSCSANGVAGPVPGVIGALQALEAIKYIVGHTHDKLLVGRMILFDGEDMNFRTVKLRPQNLDCAACSKKPTITQLLDYEVFCRAQAKEKDLNLHILPPQNRITPTELAETLHHINIGSDSNRTRRHLLVDVRSEPEYNMCRIDGAVSCPIDALHAERLDELLKKIRECTSQEPQAYPHHDDMAIFHHAGPMWIGKLHIRPWIFLRTYAGFLSSRCFHDLSVIFICRRGNDSQIAAKRVLDAIEKEHADKIKDLSGGLHAWSKDIDHDFPVY